MRNNNYQIENKNDFLTGVYLIINIPDDEVDENALLTIKDDRPDFIMPFTCKNINGQTEFTYKIGSLCKLAHLSGSVSHEQYLSMWTGLLSPLSDCRDWFMNPSCFVFDADYLYFDKNTNTAAYIYIPAKQDCFEYDALCAMVIQVAKCIKTTDRELENKVLRSVIGTFEPAGFLEMLREHSAQAAPDMPSPASDEPADITQEVKVMLTGCGLRCVGRAALPQYIQVDITEDQIFTIGRYDARLGKQQSSFEFEAKTKAISRRHAVIERGESVYTIADLSSSAGTYINDKKIPPNTPVTLEPGCRVSFGNMGADYVWESN